MTAFALLSARIILAPALIWGLGWVLRELGRPGPRRP